VIGLAGMVDQLIDILKAQWDNYEQLLELSIQKTSVIVKGDVDALKAITSQENSFVGNNQHLERDRIKLMKDIATVLGKDSQTLTLNTLIELLSGQKKDQERLEQIQNELKQVLKQIKTINDKNGMLINQALEYVDFNMNVLQSVKALPPVSYKNGGAQTQIQGTNFFDKKQ
jgi:flagellar biosynthesis/type III secretory pathway chaperone